MKKKTAILLMTLPFLLGGGQQSLEKIVEKENTQTVQQKKSYDEILEEIKEKQNSFKKRYAEAPGAQKKNIINEAMEYVNNALANNIFPEWHDTPWAFYGTTEKPNKKPKGYNSPNDSSIACGYFVTHTLRDAGFNIKTKTLAQQPSEMMIRNLSKNKSIKIYTNKSAKFMENEMKKKQKGIYIVGLDNHTGFIVNYGDSSKFVNSDYYPAKQRVVTENLTDHNPFSTSKYRVIGKIDEEMIKKWILQEPFQVRYKWKN